MSRAIGSRGRVRQQWSRSVPGGVRAECRRAAPARRGRIAAFCVAAMAALAVLHETALPAQAQGSPGIVVRRPVASADATIAASDGVRVVFVLQRQRDDLDELALSVSDPSSGNYGRFLTVAEIAARYGASRDAVARLAAFLADYGASAEVDPTGTFASAWLTHEQSRAMFGDRPSSPVPVPTALQGAVTLVVGAFRHGDALYVPPRRPVAARLVGSAVESWPPWNQASGTHAPCPTGDPLDCTNDFPNPGPALAYANFTPDQLRTAYGFERSGLTGRQRSAVVVEFGQYVLEDDVRAYTAGFGLPSLNLVQTVLDGPLDALAPGAEATLDVETIAGVAPGIDHLTLITAPVRTEGEFLTYALMVYGGALDARITGGRLPDAVSSSWGFACEPELQPVEFVDAMEALFQTAAVAGVTIVAAAGDQGSSECTSRQPPYADRQLAVAYPGSSPWVVSLGATSLQLAPDNEIVDVRVWNDWPLQLDVALPPAACATPPCRPAPVWAGAGGRSVVFDRPPWQRGDGVDPDGPRQVPDVALLGDLYPGTAIAFQGGWITGNGTSQAAPIFAAMTLLLNESAVEGGRSRIGFAAPLLYALAAREPASLIDVVDGDNVIGDNAERFAVDCCFAGPGYDLASGLGTPLVDRIAQLLASPVTIAPSDRLPVVRAGRLGRR
jgi:kumamolisin